MEISGVCKSRCAWGEDLLIQVLNAAWHWYLKGKNIHFDAQSYYTDICTCIAYRKTHLLDSNTHMGSFALYCFHRMHAELSCQPFIYKCMRQKFLLSVVPGFMAQHCTTALCVCDLSHDDGLNQSSGNTHLKLAPQLGSRRLVSQ